MDDQHADPVPFPDWTVDAERPRALAALVSVTAGEQLNALLNASGPDQAVRIARGAGQRVRERLFDTARAADCPGVFDLVVYFDKLTVAFAGPAPDLGRWAGELRFFIDHLNRMADPAYPQPGREV